MEQRGRILIIDDQEEWRDVLQEKLEQEGYHAEAVLTISDALVLLDQNTYHVLIVDIRMNESDQSNIEGLNLLRELKQRGLNEATKVIMLSAYGDIEKMHTAFRDYEVADFLDKREFNKGTFFKAVEAVFTDKVKINLDLEISWLENSEPAQAVQHLLINETPVESDVNLQRQMVEELKDLLCRLFYQARSVLVRPMKNGRSGTAVLRVQPFYHDGSGHAVVVKFGDFHLVQKEYDNYKQYVQTYLGGGRNTTIQELRRTRHLGGIIYSLLGTTHEQLVDFGEFYAKTDLPLICEAIDKLFRDTCDNWYASREGLQLLNLTEDYGRVFNYPINSLAQDIFKQLRISRSIEKLFFLKLPDSHTRPFTDPLQAIAEKTFSRPTYACITHGDFHHHNMFVDSTGHIWLIDFQETARSHILRDVAILDSVIRFQLLTETEATLEERLQMEQALCSIDRFNQVGELASAFTTTNQALARAYAVAVHLRGKAARLVDSNPEDDISEYYIALLYIALNTLRYSSLPIAQREHALLSASLLVDRLVQLGSY